MSAAVIAFSIIPLINLYSMDAFDSVKLKKWPIFRIVALVILISCPEEEVPLSYEGEGELMYPIV